VLKIEDHVVKAGGDFGQMDEIWFIPADHVNINVNTVEINNNDQPQPRPHRDTFQMELLMDNAPRDFSWTLVSESDSNGSDGTSVATIHTTIGTFTGNALTKAYSKALVELPLLMNSATDNACHTLTIKDSFGDGLTWGTPNGYFVVSLNRAEIIYRGGEVEGGSPFYKEAIVKFGNGCSAMTSNSMTAAAAATTLGFQGNRNTDHTDMNAESAPGPGSSVEPRGHPIQNHTPEEDQHQRQEDRHRYYQ
jgi:hypothetical protein